MKINDKRNSLVKHTSRIYRRREKSEITKIAIHHSATITGSTEAFARYHVSQLNWPGIAYHYVVHKDGSIDFCHDHEVISFHVGNSNGSTLGICLIGDFRFQTLENVQQNALLTLIEKLLIEFQLTFADVWGHMEFPGYEHKQCPSINMDKFRDLLARKEIRTIFKVFLCRGDFGANVKVIQQKLKDLGFNPGPIDGIFGLNTEKAVRAFQRNKGIEVDGIVGQRTWFYLFHN